MKKLFAFLLLTTLFTGLPQFGFANGEDESAAPQAETVVEQPSVEPDMDADDNQEIDQEALMQLLGGGGMGGFGGMGDMGMLGGMGGLGALLGGSSDNGGFQDLVTPTSLGGKQAWQFLEDELLLVPSYGSTFLTAIGGVAGSLGGWKLADWATTHEKYQGWLDRKFQKRVNVAKEGEKPRYERKSGFQHKVVSGFLKGAAMFLGTVGVWYLTKWGIEKYMYGYSVLRFLHDWPTKNKAKTPKLMHEFFETEHKNYKKDGWKYVGQNAKRIIFTTKAAVSFFKSKINMPVPVAPELTPCDCNEDYVLGNDAREEAPEAVVDAPVAEEIVAALPEEMINSALEDATLDLALEEATQGSYAQELALLHDDNAKEEISTAFRAPICEEIDAMPAGEETLAVLKEIGQE